MLIVINERYNTFEKPGHLLPKIYNKYKNRTYMDFNVMSLNQPFHTNSQDAIALTRPPFKILAVDDEQSILELLALNLRREGYEVQTCNGGPEALERLDEYSPDVICIDYMMPEMDGQELARQIRSRKDLLYVPIVMLTAVNTQETVKLTSLDSGVDAFLTKPVTREELKVTIRTMLRIKAAQDKMLEALNKVAEAQDELLHYERKQGQYEAMQATIAACTHELAWPLNTAEIIVTKLEKLMDIADTGAHDIKKITSAGRTYLQEMKNSMAQAQNSMHRLTEANQFTTKEVMEDNVILDLDQASHKEV
jgi:DNA-binding response OmpR family regulator